MIIYQTLLKQIFLSINIIKECHQSGEQGYRICMRCKTATYGAYLKITTSSITCTITFHGHSWFTCPSRMVRFVATYWQRWTTKLMPRPKMHMVTLLPCQCWGHIEDWEWPTNLWILPKMQWKSHKIVSMSPCMSESATGLLWGFIRTGWSTKLRTYL